MRIDRGGRTPAVLCEATCSLQSDRSRFRFPERLRGAPRRQNRQPPSIVVEVLGSGTGSSGSSTHDRSRGTCLLLLRAKKAWLPESLHASPASSSTTSEPLADPRGLRADLASPAGAAECAPYRPGPRAGVERSGNARRVAVVPRRYSTGSPSESIRFAGRTLVPCPRIPCALARRIAACGCAPGERANVLLTPLRDRPTNLVEYCARWTEKNPAQSESRTPREAPARALGARSPPAGGSPARRVTPLAPSPWNSRRRCAFQHRLVASRRGPLIRAPRSRARNPSREVREFPRRRETGTPTRRRRPAKNGGAEADGLDPAGSLCCATSLSILYARAPGFRPKKVSVVRLRPTQGEMIRAYFRLSFLCLLTPLSDHPSHGRIDPIDVPVRHRRSNKRLTGRPACAALRPKTREGGPSLP